MESTPTTYPANGPGVAGAPDWQRLLNETPPQAAPFSRAPDVAHFFEVLSPAADAYVSALNPVFLLDVRSLSALEERPFWLVRDGLVPLLWFFRKFPAPRGLRSRLLVRRELAPLVPSAWRGSIGTYRMVGASPKLAAAEPRGLLIVGLVMPSYCSLERGRAELRSVVARVGAAQLAELPIRAFLPGRFEGFGLRHDDDFYARFMIMVCQELGTRIEPIPYPELLSIGSLAGYEVVELNDLGLLADSTLLRVALTRGATLILDQAVATAAKDIPIHPHAAYRVEWSLSSAPNEGVTPAETEFLTRASEALEHYAELVCGDAAQRYPWPAWFGAWSRAARTIRP